jgi:peptidoglycan-associated lipoprotein
MHTVGVRVSQVLACAFLVTACGGRQQPEPPTPEEPAQSSPAPASTTTGTTTLGPATRDDVGAARAVLAEPIYFGFDRADLSAEARARLDRKAEVLQSNGDVRVTVAGHTDERGSAEYNLALGMRRAAEAKRYLVGRGVPADRLDVLSHGEEQPADAGHNETAWAANRRAEFAPTAGALATSER